MTDPRDVFDHIKRMRMDLTQLQARVTTLSELLSAMNLPDSKPSSTGNNNPTCPTCGIGAGHHLEDCDLAPSAPKAYTPDG